MSLSFLLFIIHASSFAQNSSWQKVAYALQSGIFLGSSSPDGVPESSSMGLVQQVSLLCLVILGLSPHLVVLGDILVTSAPAREDGILYMGTV